MPVRRACFLSYASHRTHIQLYTIPLQPGKKTQTHLLRRKFDIEIVRRPICVIRDASVSGPTRFYGQCKNTYVKYTQFGGPVAPPFSLRYIESYYANLPNFT